MITEYSRQPRVRQDLTFEQVRALLTPAGHGFLIWNTRPGPSWWNKRYAGELAGCRDPRSGVYYIKIYGWRYRADELLAFGQGYGWSIEQEKRWDTCDFLRWERHFERRNGPRPW